MNLFVTLALFSEGHIVLIVLGLILFFGGKKIPELMKGIGEGVREFKKASKGDDKAHEAEKTESIEKK